MTNLMYPDKRLWKFFEYVTTNGRGVITDWVRKDIEKRAKIRFHTTLQYLSVLERDLWNRPEYCPFGPDISELRFDANKLQHRVFGFFIPDTNHYLMVIGTTKKGRIYTPRDAIKTAKERKKEFSNGGKLIEYEDYQL